MFSHWYFIVPLRDTRLTILTCKELRYKLLTFTIFIIQSQVGAIPVFSRLSWNLGRHFYHFRLQIPWVQGQRKSWVRAEVVICTVASMCSVVHLCTVAHRGHATFFLSRNKIKTSRDKWKLSRDNFIIYRAINGKHGGSRNRLSRTLFPWTTMTSTVEEVCFEVNSSFYLSKKII